MDRKPVKPGPPPPYPAWAPVPLEYAHGKYENRQPVGRNIAIGMFAGMVVNGLTILAFFGGRAQSFAASIGPLALFIPSMLLIVIAIPFAFKPRFRGLLGGVLLGFGASCLLPIGALFVLCGGK